MDCEMKDTCPFFATKTDDSKAIELLKQVYCQGHQHQCARYRVLKAVGRKNVPLTLYPNQIHLVEGIIKRARETPSTPHGQKKQPSSEDRTKARI